VQAPVLSSASHFAWTSEMDHSHHHHHLEAPSEGLGSYILAVRYMGLLGDKNLLKGLVVAFGSGVLGDLLQADPRIRTASWT